MKRFKHGIVLMAAFVFLFYSCNKDDAASPDTNPEMATLTFGTSLNDLINRQAKAHFSDIPECSDAEPSSVRIILSLDGENMEPLMLNILSDDINNDGITDYFTEYSEELELSPDTYQLEEFIVYDSSNNMLWIAPIDEDNSGEFAGYVQDALPLTINLSAGVKKYVNVEVLCFDDRTVNEYGYVFFDIDANEIIQFCIFGNFCDENGRHFVAEYDVNVWYGTDANGTVLYSDGNEAEVNNDGDVSADPLCIALPDADGEDNYYFEISMDGNVIRSGVITDADVKDLFVGEDNNEYYHFFEGNCNQEDTPNLFEGDDAQTASFTVTIENVVQPKPIFQSGVFNTPVGASGPAPLFPGDAYEFEINAGPVVLPMDGGTRLSFVAMFVQSNDLFFAPSEEGIHLYDGSGNPIGESGPEDVTDQVLLWDSGTEVNEATGGPNQKPQQAPDAEDQGIDEGGVVTEITGNIDSFGNVIPDANEVIKVTIENTGDAKFLVRIENVSTPTTIPTPAKGEGTTAAVPISPGVYAVHTTPAPFFMRGQEAAGAGLVASAEGVENIAEDGFPQALAADTFAATGLIVPLSPGAWAVHEQGTMPIYEFSVPVLDNGLEAVAEDGKSMALANYLSTLATVSASAAFNTPVGASNPGPIGPGQSYQFSFTASEDENLSLATMFIQSNDWFYAFRPTGIALFEDGIPIDGEVTSMIFLYDSGTEINEYPGAGLFQVIRQPSLNTGPADPNNDVRLITTDAFNNIPPVSSVIKVTIESN